MVFTLKQKAIIALIVVAVSSVFLNIAARFMSAGFGPFTQVYLRIGLGVVLTFLFFYRDIRYSRIKKISKRDLVILLLMGTVGYGIAVDFVTLGVLHTKLLNVAIISSTTPLFVFLFTILIWRKAFKIYLLLFLLLTYYGVLVISTRAFLPGIASFNIGDLFVLLYAAGVGVYLVGRKSLSSNLNNTEIAIVVMVIAFLCSFISALFAGEKLSVAGFFNQTAFIGLVIGGVLNLVATKLQNFSFHHLDVVTSSQLLLTENVVAPFFGFFLYGETILPVEFFGALLVIAGVWFYIKYGED